MDFVKMCILGLILWIGLFITGMNGQREMDVNLVLSTPIVEGDDLKMKCLFIEPSNTSVLSVKWYRGYREIFRYEHKPFPKKQVLPFANLIIDESNSDMHTLKLKNVPAFMTGDMKCEVTLEDPKARAMMKTSQLLVVIPPKEKPKLDAKMKGLSQSQQKLVANCTSGPAKPAANLTFYINDSPLYESQSVIIIEQPDFRTFGEQNLTMRKLELDVHLQQEHFIKGKVRLKCVSTQYNVHNVSSEEFEGAQLRPSTQKQNSPLNGINGGRRGSASGMFNPSWTILKSFIGKSSVLAIFILWY